MWLLTWRTAIKAWGLGNPDETDVRVHEVDGITLVDTSRCPERGAELETDYTKERNILHPLWSRRQRTINSIAYYKAGPNLLKVFENYEEYITAETLTESLIEDNPPQETYKETYKIEGESLLIGVKQVKK